MNAGEISMPNLLQTKCHTILHTATFLLLVLAAMPGCNNKQAAQTSYKEGMEHMEQGHWDAASRSFDECLGNDPEFHAALFRRGIARLNIAQYEQALADFNVAIANENQYEHYRLARGIAHVQLGHYQDALADFSRVLRDEDADEEMLSTARMLHSLTQKAIDYNLDPATLSIDPGQLLLEQPEAEAQVEERAFARYGLIGRSEFFQKHPGWSIGGFVPCYFVLLLFISAAFSAADEEGVKFMGPFLIGIGLFWLCWGYNYWGWWIGAGLLSAFWGVIAATTK